MIRGEKVKDIVDVRSFNHLSDFAADPALTTASYRFTDITSGLMGNWFDRISDIRPGRGAAYALAGLRGVGKSHFLAVVAALASRAELRSTVGDVHVHSRLERLPKRSLPVAFVRRGSETSLIAELRTALAAALAININELSDSLYDVLLRASEIAADGSLVIFVDTVFGRQNRVGRDDGVMLSEIAEASKNIGIFVGIALDDDISGADGPNSSIARSFQIDFLDQEHLYKIVDRHVFPKNDAMLPLLKDIYSGYRSEIPGFKWSEQRFLPLYPMHPATLEISPLIRLFIQDFALLGFASEAGVKIMGRPADSLIGLDEMFGKVEDKLRKSPQLESAFRDFDTLDKEVVQKSPVQFRLQAKLILKGLLLLSLDGHGASAATIAASMMVFDEKDPSAGLEKVEQLLDRFAMEFPAVVMRVQDENSAARYCLKIGLDQGLDQAIESIKTGLSDSDCLAMLLHQLSERFPEIRDEENNLSWITHVTAEWRGGMRRGEIVWSSEIDTDGAANTDQLDWQIRLVSAEASGASPDNEKNILVWQAAQLTPEETDILVKCSALRSNPEIRQRFGESASTALQLLSTSLDKICHRVFFDDAFIRSEEREFPMRFDFESIHNLSQLVTLVLRPVFESLYPSHPYFLHPLGVREVTQLITGFFGRSDVTNPQIQNLAQCIAEPLGLAENAAEGYVSASADKILSLPFVEAANKSWTDAETVSFSALSGIFKKGPFGLTRESQQLILAALVAHREIEFVTATGNRINHRSLDLQIIWDDIIGVARPKGEKYTKSRLLSWAKILTGNDSLKSFDRAEDIAFIEDSFQRWLSDWTNGKILENYEELPDESLNAASWRNVSALRRSLGSVAGIINSYVSSSIGLDECLSSVADLFLDSESEYLARKAELHGLKSFSERAYRLEGINRYILRVGATEFDDVEDARRILFEIMELPISEPAALNAAWEGFIDVYKARYQIIHRELFESTDRNAISREIKRSNEWQRFEAYSLLSTFDDGLRSKVERLIRRYRDASCNNFAAEMLDSSPTCACGFSLNDLDRMTRSPQIVRSLVAEASSQESSIGAINSPSYQSNDAVILNAASSAGILNS